MEKIKITFPSGVSVRATLLRDAEPELAESLWQKLETQQKGITHVTVSTGDSFSLFFRPLREPPATAGTLRAPIGNHRLFYTELEAGNLLWNNIKMYFCYGPCTEPGLVGAQVAQVDPEDMETYKRECEEVRNHTYFYHKLAVVKVEREVA